MVEKAARDVAAFLRQVRVAPQIWAIGRRNRVRVVAERLVATSCLLFFSAAKAPAQDALTEEKRADAARLIQMVGGAQIGLQFGDAIVQLMTNQLKAARPDMPPRVPEIVREEVMKLLQERIGDFVDLVVPIYHQHFTHGEIKGLLEFYGTPLGSKVIQELPLIVRESITMSTHWGESIAPLFQERLRARFAKEGIK